MVGDAASATSVVGGVVPGGRGSAADTASGACGRPICKNIDGGDRQDDRLRHREMRAVPE